MHARSLTMTSVPVCAILQHSDLRLRARATQSMFSAALERGEPTDQSRDARGTRRRHFGWQTRPRVNRQRSHIGPPFSLGASEMSCICTSGLINPLEARVTN